jgi:ribosomal protein S18 acetylase RimI-like enzyme
VPRPPEIPHHVLGFWRELDLLFARVVPTRWGAVVTDARFPAVWDANYARVDTPPNGLTLAEVEEALLPALRAAGTTVEHLVSFRPDATGGVIGELEARGHRLTWDLVMDLDEDPPDVDLGRVEELIDAPELWERVGESLSLFGVEDEETLGQLAAIERDVLAAGGKRWFGVRDDEGTIVSLGALLVLGDVGYIDNVATFEHARGRGLASLVTVRAIHAARQMRADHVSLFADPDDRSVVSMYERLGFREAGSLVATRGPAPDRARSVRPAERGSAPR